LNLEMRPLSGEQERNMRKPGASSLSQMATRGLTREVTVAASTYAKEKKYWLNRFSENFEKTFIPYSKNVSPQHQRFMEKVCFVCSSEIHEGCRKLTGGSAPLVFIILVTGLVSLIEKVTGNSDIIIGIPVFKQDFEGDFINTVLALRTQCQSQDTFKELLLKVKQAVMEANEHQNYPLETLLYALNLQYIPGEDFPLFDVAVLLENIHEKSYLDHLNLNLIFCFREKKDGMLLEVDYNGALYTQETIETLYNHFSVLLGKTLANNRLALSQLDLLREEEKRVILEEFNNTYVNMDDTEKTVDALIQRQVLKTPDKSVAWFNDKIITFRKLDEKSCELALKLRQKGAGTGTITAIIEKPSIQLIAGLVSILRAGSCYLPLEPELPLPRIEYILKDSGVSTVLAPKENTRNMTIPLFYITIDSEEDLQGKEGTPGAEKFSNSWDPAYVLYTSGTTGRPKAVVIQHKAICNYLQWASTTYVGDSRNNFPLFTPIYFDLTKTSIFLPLITGNSIVIFPEQDKDNLLERIVTQGQVRMVKLTPSHIKLLKEKMFPMPESTEKISTGLKGFIVGGESFDVDLATDLRENLKGKFEIYNEYGPTETTVGCTFHKWDHQKETTGQVPIGNPIHNTRIYILDKNQNLVPLGVTGEIYVSGEGLSMGYLNQVELTSEKFLKDKFRPGEQMYRTGDLARWSWDAKIEYLGRVDQQLKIRGYRIEPGEIEHQLKRHSNVKEAVVRDWNDMLGDKHIIAYVVCTSVKPEDSLKSSAMIREMKEFLRNQLPNFMVPSYFVLMDRIPLSTHGKIDWEALPTPEVGSLTDEPIDLNDEVESVLLDLWAEVLGIGEPMQKIGRDSNFFDLGGHSLKATILLSKIEKEFQVQMSLAEIFRSPYIRNLSEYIKQNKGTQTTYRSIYPVEQKEYYPVSSAQKRMYILNQMKGEDTSDNTPEALLVEGTLDKDRFEESIHILVKRHETFRTSFHLKDKEPIQRIHARVKLNIDIEKEYSGEMGQDSFIKKQIKDFIRPFDLGKAPLLRIRLIPLLNRNRSYLLLYDIHHIIKDSASSGIFINEFIRVYTGKPLPMLRIQYIDFSQWQNRMCLTPMIRRQEKYWIQRYTKKALELQLPLDYPRPAIQSFKGKNILFELDEELTSQLKTIATEYEATLFMVLLSVYCILLSKYSEQEDVVVGVPIAGRSHADLEHVIGFFVNTLAMRNYPVKDKKFSEFLEEVKNNSLQDYENQAYQFEELIRKLGIKRESNRNPLFDTMFAVYDEFEIEEQGIQGLNFSPYRFEEKTSIFEIVLYIFKRGQRLDCKIWYFSSLFKGETIQHFIVNFKEVIETIILDPEVQIQDIQISHGLFNQKLEIPETGFDF
jgi:amino acid adenylation domain-containing protein